MNSITATAAVDIPVELSEIRTSGVEDKHALACGIGHGKGVGGKAQWSASA